MGKRGVVDGLLGELTSQKEGGTQDDVRRNSANPPSHHNPYVLSKTLSEPAGPNTSTPGLDRKNGAHGRSSGEASEKEECAVSHSTTHVQSMPETRSNPSNSESMNTDTSFPPPIQINRPSGKVPEQSLDDQATVNETRELHLGTEQYTFGANFGGNNNKIEFEGGLAVKYGLNGREKVFLDGLARKILDTQKFTKHKNWTLKDVLATGHLHGLQVEYRAKLGDAKGSGIDGTITEKGKIICKCGKCVKKGSKSHTYTGTKWEEHFGGRSQRPFRHIFFKDVDICLKDFCEEWCEKIMNTEKRIGPTVQNRAGNIPRRKRKIPCVVCSGGGAELTCAGCNSLFHLKCLEMKRQPVGEFFCEDCVKVGRDIELSFPSEFSNMDFFPQNGILRGQLIHGKRKMVMPNNEGLQFMAKKRRRSTLARFLGNGLMTNASRDFVWAAEQRRKLLEVSNGCACILRELDYVCGSCVLCGSPDYEEVHGKQLSARTIIICDTCECEYHIGCLKRHKMVNLKELPDGDWFCSHKCKKVNSVLLHLIAEDETPLEKKLAYCILRGRLTTQDTLPKIRRVEQIIMSSFDPIIDAISNDSLLPMMVRGRRVENSWDFSGFHSIMLKDGRNWVAAGLFKVYRDSAEVPFVATGPEYRGQGYSLRMMQILEVVVKKAGVRKLLLPSAEATVNMWLKPKYGFKRASEDYSRRGRFLQFPGTVWLEKHL